MLTALERQAASSDALGRRIEHLNVWLLRVTVAIGVLTLAQVLVAAVGIFWTKA